MRFLHRLDTRARTALFAETELEDLRKATFLDGREQFWSSLATEDLRSIEDAIRPPRKRSVSWIFHMGFCGSTLLSRMLERPGNVLCLREPQSLIDLSNQMASAAQPLKEKEAELLVGGLSAHYAGIGGKNERVVIKPSNWANPLLPLLSKSGLVARAVYVTMERSDWLRACVRGGHDRLAFIARCTQQFVQHRPQHSPLLQGAVAGTADPVSQIVRLAALLHAMQSELFDEADPTGNRRIDFAEIIHDPAEAVRRAQKLLSLPRSAELGRNADWHAKDPNRRFNPTQRSREDRAVDEAHGERIAAALAWIDGTGQFRPAKVRAA